MAMPQRDKYIEELKQLEGLLEYAVEHNETAEIERIRKEMARILKEVE